MNPPYIIGSREVLASLSSSTVVGEIPIFESLRDTSTLMEGVSPSAILVKVAILFSLERLEYDNEKRGF
jgi:hypothetical protein